MADPVPTVSVNFTDSTGTYTSQSAAIIANVEAAFAMWVAHLAPSAATIEVNLRIIPGDFGGGGGSLASVQVGSDGAIAIREQGAAYELRTGIDPNGAEADVDVFFKVGALDNYYWINPLDGTPLPAAQNDLVDVIAHELGHALGFNGWRDWATYALPGDYESTFDALLEQNGAYMYFTGAHTSALYGGNPVLTAGNVYHFGNNSPAPGADLIPDLMNGIVFEFRDYDVSALDIAVLSDIGMATELDDRLVGGAEDEETYAGSGDDEMLGGGGADFLYGGLGRDRLEGDGGADKLAGGKGKDLFALTAQGDSNSTAYDTITDFDAAKDRMELWFKPPVDPTVDGGTLRSKHFADDLEAALQGAQLNSDHAVLFLPDSGNFAGRAVVAIDVNGIAGFQADADAVVVLRDARHLEDFDNHVFVSTATIDVPMADLAEILRTYDLAGGFGMADAVLF